MQSLLAAFLGDAPHNQGGNRATNAPFVGAVRPPSPFLSGVSHPRLADGWVRSVSILGTDKGSMQDELVFQHPLFNRILQEAAEKERASRL